MISKENQALLLIGSLWRRRVSAQLYMILGFSESKFYTGDGRTVQFFDIRLYNMTHGEIHTSKTWTAKSWQLAYNRLDA